MTTTAALAAFLGDVSYDGLPADVREATRKRLYDAVGVALGALAAADESTVDPVRDTATDVSGEGPATLWGVDRSAAVPQAAMVNATLTRALDFQDSFRAPGETSHPIEVVAPIVACGELVDASGADLLAAIAAAYQVQGELAWNAPVRDRGFDAVTHSVLAQAAGAAKIMDLDREATEDALAIAGVAHNALGVTRTGDDAAWQHVAGGNAARNGAYAALLASNGLEGPPDLFEGEQGWKAVIAGDFDLDLDPACPRVTDAMAKRYLAGIDAQTAVEASIELAQEHYVDPDAVTHVRLTTFEDATVGMDETPPDETSSDETRAAARTSLPYLVAVAILDCSMGPDQFSDDRIRSEDVQSLMDCVAVETDAEFTDRFEAGEMPARVEIELTTEDTLSVEKSTYAGHPDAPMDWNQLRQKFAAVTDGEIGSGRRDEIEDIVRNLADHDVSDLVACL